MGIGVSDGGAHLETRVPEEAVKACSIAVSAGVEAGELGGVIAILDAEEGLIPETVFARGRVVVAEIGEVGAEEGEEIEGVFEGDKAGVRKRAGREAVEEFVEESWVGVLEAGFNGT